MLFLERTNTLNYKTCLVLSWSQSVSLSVLFLVSLSLVVSFVWLLFLSFSVPVLFSFCLSVRLSCSRTLPLSFFSSLCLSSSLYLFVPVYVSLCFFKSLGLFHSCSLLPFGLFVSLSLCLFLCFFVSLFRLGLLFCFSCNLVLCFRKAIWGAQQLVLIRLRWGWVFLERTRILSGIQFTTYFIEIFVMETKRFVGNFVNVILTRQLGKPAASAGAELRKANAER